MTRPSLTDAQFEALLHRALNIPLDWHGTTSRADGEPGTGSSLDRSELTTESTPGDQNDTRAS
jgi:hypothetical protein